MLKDKKHIHFVGIGGIGMSALASYLQDKGYIVSGSDLEESENTQRLQSQGVRISIGHKSEHVKNADLVVYSAAISRDNQELLAANKKNIPTISRADLLAEISKLTDFSIAVSGTHGKTSTTSILGFILKKAGLNPVIISGGILKNFGTNFIPGGNTVTIVEADEYNKSFLTLNPDYAIITNIDADHMECYSDLKDLQNNFIQFANQVKSKVVLCKDEKNISNISEEIATEKAFFSSNGSGDFNAEDIQFHEGKTTFTLNNQNFQIPLIGIHNVRNTLAAITVASEFNIGLQTISLILQEYKGVNRRFEIIYQDENNIYVDDYAHHPEEIRKTINAAKNSWKNKNILAIFQPHLYSRTQFFYKEFAQALSEADKVVVTNIYPAREKPITGVTGKMIFDALLRLKNTDIEYAATEKEWVEKVLKIKAKNDLIISLGAGDINKVHQQLINK